MKTEINRGWVLSNNEKNDVVIQKNDESNRFKTDNEATRFVVESYHELLETCKEALDFIMWNDCQEFKHYTDIKETLEEKINKAEGVQNDT